MIFNPWLFRGAERDRAYARLNAIQAAYGEHGGRVVRLSARTDLLRKSAGATARSFEAVETTFLAATSAYSRVQERIDGLELGLSQGKVGDLAGVESAVKELGPKFDELERALSHWESHWERVPREIDDSAAALAELQRQVEAAAAKLGVRIPLQNRLEVMQAHLSKIQSTQAAGNPIEAGHLVNDLRIAMAKVGEAAALYVSGSGAIEQAERDLTAIQGRIGELAPAEAVAATASAKALLPRLREALVAGRLDQFQHDLLEVQKHLSAARATLK